MSKVAIYIMFMLVKFAAIYFLAILGWILYIRQYRRHRRVKRELRALQAQMAVYAAAEAVRAEEKAARARKVRGRKSSTGSGGTMTPPSSKKKFGLGLSTCPPLGSPPLLDTTIEKGFAMSPKESKKKFHLALGSPTSLDTLFEEHSPSSSGLSTPESDSNYPVSPVIIKKPLFRHSHSASALGLMEEMTGLSPISEDQDEGDEKDGMEV